jgi:putative tryptophan/tyrosine transport system substrate-binding protein
VTSSGPSEMALYCGNIMTTHSQLDRRRFLQGSLVLAGCALLAGCGTLPSQAKLRRVGYLGHANSPATGPTESYDALAGGLRELGWVEGRTIALEPRWTEGRPERIPELANELVHLPVEVLVAGDYATASAAAAATDTLPIVFLAVPDPVGRGLVCSLAHPCGNLTGLSTLAEGLDSKRLELLADTVPGLSRVAILWHQPAMLPEFQRSLAATQVRGIQLLSMGVADPDGIPSAFRAGMADGAQALVTVTNGLTQRAIGRIVQLAAEHRIPAMYQSRDFVDAGGLMSYGPSVVDQHRRAASYVDRILKGAKPVELPVEQPTEFEFVLNLKTAQAMGLTFPQSLVQQGTELLQ